MSHPTDAQKSRIGFCSAPWTDCITYADGSLKACDRNIAGFGNWQVSGLKRTWESDSFQEFRRAISEGRYPNQDCASCHNNGTQRTALSSLVGAYHLHYQYLAKHLGQETLPELALLYPLLLQKERSEETDASLARFFAELDRLRQSEARAYETAPRFHQALVKLRVIAESLEDYLGGVLRPRRVATFRQSQLQAKCTARCVMCVGLYTGEIANGPTMGAEYIDEAFAEMEDVTDFWCNGAEYLFFKDWKKVALKLANEGVKMRVSTNGILLNEANIDFMLDHGILGFLTVSLDGATKSTMEAIRIRANFDKNMERIRYLLRRATELGQHFEFTAAFVMMRRNLPELPRFVRLMKELMPEECLPLVTVLCQPLENFSVDGYRQFVHREHHALLGEEELRRIFQETHLAQRETGVRVSFYNQCLDDFVAAGMPFPKFFARADDIEYFRNGLLRGDGGFAGLDAILDRELLTEAGNASPRSSAETERLTSRLLEHLRGNGVVAETMREFPAFAEELPQLLARYLESYQPRMVGEMAEFGAAGANAWVEKEFSAAASRLRYDLDSVAAHLAAELAKKFPDHAYLTKAVDTAIAASRYVTIKLAAMKSELIHFRKAGLVVVAKRYQFAPHRRGDCLYHPFATRPALAMRVTRQLVAMHDGQVVPSDARLVVSLRDENSGEPRPLPAMSESRDQMRALLFLLLHSVKVRLIGNRKSPFLWKLSVLYRRLFATLGVKARGVW